MIISPATGTRTG